MLVIYGNITIECKLIIVLKARMIDRAQKPPTLRTGQTRKKTTNKLPRPASR